MLGLEIPRQSQAVSLSWVLLVLDLGPLSKRYGGWDSTRPAVAYLKEFRKWWSMSPDQLWMAWAIPMEKLLLTAVYWVWWSLRGSPGQGKQCDPGWWSLRYGTHLLAVWLCPPFYLGERCPPALTLMPDTSVPPCMSMVSFKLLPQCWSSQGMSLSKFVCGFFKRNCLRPPKFLPPT